MNIGRLDKRVVLERFTATQNDIGEWIEEWAPLVSVWAAVEPLNGREFFAAGGAQAETTTRIRIRYRPGITSGDRVNQDGVLHDITATINPRTSDRELVLMCKAGAS